MMDLLTSLLVFPDLTQSPAQSQALDAGRMRQGFPFLTVIKKAFEPLCAGRWLKPWAP